MKKLPLILSLILIISAVMAPITSFASYETDGFTVESKSAILYSMDTGEIMFTKNADKKSYPASLTKLMTGLVVVQNCDDLDSIVTCDATTYAELLAAGSTVANLKDGEQISVRNLLHLLLISSDADAANALAQYIGGTIENFISMMNAEAKSLKMNSTNYVNAHGLHDDNHYTTANDLLKLTKKVVQTPVLYDICCKSVYTVPKTNLSDARSVSTTNLMLDASTSFYYKYAKGLKTGFTTPAGRCLISTASYKGYNYISIILGGDDTNRTEYSDTKALYRWAFLNFEYRKIADTTDQISEIKVNLSWDTDHVQLFPEKPISAIVPSDIENSSIIYDVVLSADSVNAPIKKGEVLGYARVLCANEEVAKVNLVAGEDVNRSIMLLLKETAVTIITSTIFQLLCLGLFIMIVCAVIVNVIHNKRKRRQVRKVTRIQKF